MNVIYTIIYGWNLGTCEPRIEFLCARVLCCLIKMAFWYLLLLLGEPCRKDWRSHFLGWKGPSRTVGNNQGGTKHGQETHRLPSWPVHDHLLLIYKAPKKEKNLSRISQLLDRTIVVQENQFLTMDISLIRLISLTFLEPKTKKKNRRNSTLPAGSFDPINGAKWMGRDPSETLSDWKSFS